MPDIIGTVEGSEEMKRMLREAGKQLPFTLSLAANRTINAAQEAIRNSLPLKFHLRRWDFVTRTIYRRPGIWPTGDNASKAEPTAAVRVHPDRDFLAKFEEGGTKTSRRAGNLLLPTLRLDNPNLIIRRSDPLHISKLPGSLDKSGKLRTKSRLGVFLLQKPGGAKFILQRLTHGVVRVLYTFRRAVSIPKKLGFYETGVKAIDATWEKNLGEALDKALKTAR
jgi:hypothetical protein